MNFFDKLILCFIFLALGCRETKSSPSGPTESATSTSVAPDSPTSSSTSTEFKHENNHDFHYINLQGARAIFIAEDKTSILNLTKNTKRLFAINSDGLVAPVEFKNKEGDKLQNPPEITAFFDVGPIWAVVEINQGHYIVRKSDGQVFSLENLGNVEFHRWNYTSGYSRVQQDSDGNIFLMIKESETIRRLARINVNDPEKVDAMFMTPETDNVEGFVVSPYGNTAYAFTDSTDPNKGIAHRIVKGNKGLVNIGSQTWLPTWINRDGSIGSCDGNRKIHKIDLSFQVAIESYEECKLPNASGKRDVIRRSNRIIFVSRELSNDDYDLIVEVDNDQNIFRKINLTKITRINLATASNNYLYISGNDSSNNPILLRLSLIDDTEELFLDSNSDDFDVLQMTVSADDILYLNALRMDDGARVIATWDTEKKLKIIDENIDQEVIMLQKIE